MALVHIPAALRTLTGGETSVTIPGETLREVLDRLDEAYPGIKERMVQGDRMAPGMAVFVDGAIPAGGLRAKLAPDAEIYFAPAIAGGNPQPAAESAGSSGDKILRAFAQAVSQEPGDLDAAKEHWSVRLLLQADRKAVRPLRAAAPAREAPAAISPAPAHNVVGIGVGEKLVDRKHTGTLAVKFLVKLKYRESDIENKHRLPKSIDGLPVDVEEVGIFRAFQAPMARASSRPAALVMPNPRTRFRPAQPGCSVGFRVPGDQFVMAGTFGAMVTDGTDPFILSNNHVLADENRLAPGSPIFQPGLLDGGRVSTDQIAELTRFVPVQMGAFNQVDCAVARPVQSDLVSNAILFIGPPQGTTAAQRDMIVHKFGRTTGYQVGRVTSVNTDVKIRYDMGEVVFRRQIVIEGLNGQPFSAQGDSGSLILERQTQQAIGLLFGGSPSHTIANHIEDVLQALNVSLA